MSRSALNLLGQGSRAVGQAAIGGLLTTAPAVAQAATQAPASSLGPIDPLALVQPLLIGLGLGAILGATTGAFRDESKEGNGARTGLNWGLGIGASLGLAYGLLRALT